MWSTLALVLPVVFPSWRFFKSVEPSPRVQWAILANADETPERWHDFRPRPARVTFLRMLARLAWNPHWNDTLFVVSCAERIQQSPTPHSINEIARRVLLDIQQSRLNTHGKVLQFRLVFVHRTGSELSEQVVFTSDIRPIPAAAC